MKQTSCLLLAVLFASSVVTDSSPAAEPNELRPEEKQRGWKLLFDGETTKGWRNYKKDTVSDGWQVKDGVLSRVGNGAGDIITKKEYGAFELSLEYRISKGGNSGVMFHVTESEPRPYHSGPEIQIQDNVDGHDPQKAGWLYQLYSASEDATRPAGEWNELFIRIHPQQSAIYMNGVRYARFVKGSKDWNKRVADSKFAKWDAFGKADEGHICLQDHGNLVSFRDIKIRELPVNGELPPIADARLPLESEIAFPNLEWTGYTGVTPEGKVQPMRPIVLTHAGDGSNRIFVATQRGVIHVFKNDPQAAQKTKIFLDLTDRVVYSDKQNEEGFLGLAFHPKYEENGELYVYYTTKEVPQTSIISRFKVSKDDPNKALADSEEELLRIKQPFWNHNGGTVEFGPDGYLYIALGDGGSANDPYDNAQNLGTLLGSILRIDVDHHDPGKKYAIPEDNPFAGQEDKRGEIYAYGLRNPWRISFDRKTGTMWAGDVGQNLYEEIDIIVKGGNYGWNRREGRHMFGKKGQPAGPEFVEPVFEYDHQAGKSITGGHVYRGSKFPELYGKYVFADYVTGKIWALDYDADQDEVKQVYALSKNEIPVMSFGEDEEGELYFMIVTLKGELYRFGRAK